MGDTAEQKPPEYPPGTDEEQALFEQVQLAAPRSLFCLLELLTAIHHQKEVVLVRDLSYHLPMEPGQIAALCLPVLLGKMVRIKACGEQFTDDRAALRLFKAHPETKIRETWIQKLDQFAPAGFGTTGPALPAYLLNRMAQFHGECEIRERSRLRVV